MKRKFSQKFIWATRDFVRAAKVELGHEFDEDKVDVMLDAFDPTLKKQMFLEMLIGNNGIRIRKIDSGTFNKIQVIKAVRSITGFDLKRAKDVVDLADTTASEIEGNWSAEDYNKFSRELVGTGYILV